MSIATAEIDSPLSRKRSRDQQIGDLIQRLESAISGAEYLSKPFFGDKVVHAAQLAVVRASSPWLSRQDAGQYWRCSEWEIDRAAKAGTLRKYMRGGTPMFLKAEGDEAIKTGRWVKK